MRNLKYIPKSLRRKLENLSWTEFRKKQLFPAIIVIVTLVIGQLGLYNLGRILGLEFKSQVIVQLAFFLLFSTTVSIGKKILGFVFIYRAVVPLTCGIGMVWLYHAIYSSPTSAALVEASYGGFDYIKLLFDVLATLYAICTAFLLWKGLTDYDELRSALSSESTTIERLLGYLHYFDLTSIENTKIAKTIRESLRQYILNVQEGDTIKFSEENTGILQSCGSAIADIDPKDKNDEIALAETMKSLSDLRTARSRRNSQLDVTMSPYILIALTVMSLGILYPFFTKSPVDNLVNAACIFVLTMVLSFLLVTLLDISTPFNGYWKVKTDAFEKILNQIETEINDSGQSQHKIWTSHGTDSDKIAAPEQQPFETDDTDS